MRNQSMIRRTVLAAGLTAAFALIPLSQVAAQDAGANGSMQSSNQTVPDKAADAWITTKVKSEFGTSKAVKATDVSVTTVDGTVSLSGTVGSAQEKLEAVRVAKSVKGVKGVDASGLTVSASATH
ncbi:transport-associated protein [Rhodanobacter fulvus Jip2]|uniref:Transport-associated protein n=1 Tax=Rhodanobacter fulvus Jip2 TaxID=1163408 RepID=I4VZK0_9GAMM|nr:BON domain-containing protein [Rhodanobacter fulvus]EIL92641.1 transport-associated protein [Rhodanobacter fulvus Jip2]